MELPPEYRQRLREIAASMQISMPRCPPTRLKRDTGKVTVDHYKILLYAKGTEIKEEMQEQFNRFCTHYDLLENYSIDKLEEIVNGIIVEEVIVEKAPVTITTYYNPDFVRVPWYTTEFYKYVENPTGEFQMQSQLNYIIKTVGFEGDTEEIIREKVNTYLYPHFKTGGRACGIFGELAIPKGAIFWANGRYYGYMHNAVGYDYRVAEDYMQWLIENSDKNMSITSQAYSNPLKYGKITAARMREAEAIVRALAHMNPRVQIYLPGDGLGIFSFMCKRWKLRYISSEPNKVGQIALGLGLITNTDSGISQHVTKAVMIASYLALYVDVSSWQGTAVALDDRYEVYAKLGYQEVVGTGMRVWVKNLERGFIPRMETYNFVGRSVRKQLRAAMEAKNATHIWASDAQMARALHLADLPVHSDIINGYDETLTYIKVGYEKGEINIWTEQDHQTFMIMRGRPTIMGKDGDNVTIGNVKVPFMTDIVVCDELTYVTIEGIPHEYIPRMHRKLIGTDVVFVTKSAYERKLRFLGVYMTQVSEFIVTSCIRMPTGIYQILARMGSADVTERQVEMIAAGIIK